MGEPFAALELNKLDAELSKSSRRRLTASDGSSKYQEKRRSEALHRQQQARLDRAQQARQLASRATSSPSQVRTAS